MSHLEIGRIVLATGLFALVLVRIGTLLVYFQQEEYTPSRFLWAAWRIPLFDILGSSVLAITMLANILAPAASGAIQAVAGLTLAALSLRERGYQFKKASITTARLRRIRLLAMLFAASTLLLPFLFSVLLGVVILQILPLVLIAANFVLAPVQKRIDESFIDEARRKLSDYSGLRIGVTGSFGKTTVKHLLGDLLDVDGPVFYSRGSINTILGLTRHIRERLQPGHRYFIAEMGAYGQGSIRRLCEFVQPSVGIITAIGSAHTERFGSLETVGRAKSELAEWIIAHGDFVAITEQVGTFEPIRTLRASQPDKFVVCGRSAASDILVDTWLANDRRVVKLTLNKLDGRVIECDIRSLGEYEALNVALVVAVISRICPALLDQLPFLLPQVAQVAHRLEIKDVPGRPLVLDDAYNSNETGFGNAIEVAATLARNRGGRAILITPGIVELGNEHDAVHARLGTASAVSCDLAIVVNSGRIPTFVEAFIQDAGEGRLIRAASLAEARAALDALSLKAEDVILYENDLPDLYESRRLL